MLQGQVQWCRFLLEGQQKKNKNNNNNDLKYRNSGEIHNSMITQLTYMVIILVLIIISVVTIQ